MFDADRPISTSSQDRLERTQFARYLARSLLDHKDPESLVVGLYGGWGVGKTSVINLMLEELNFAASNMYDEEKPIILNFSPWSYSGQGHLVYNFYRRLLSVLQEAENLQNKKRILYLLELYLSYFTEKVATKKKRKLKRTFWEKITFQKAKEQFLPAWESGQDLTKVKAELNELLAQEECRIIIIIDNISRIYGYEIKQIFQIVKSMADYNNTSYVLSFNKDMVIDAIDNLDGEGGEELVEKIVQLPFEIPPISPQDLEVILADRLMEIVELVPEEAWNNEYWADIYYNSIKYYFTSCRDITRYINTLGFGYSRLRDIVHPVDYFALTAIEVFAPRIYEGIRDNKDLFTDLLDHVYIDDKIAISKEKERCDEILNRDTAIPRDILLECLMRLFPRLRSLYQPETEFYHSENIARKNKRVCSPDAFDAYFRLFIPTSGMPITEFKTILAIASDKEEFDHALTRLNQDGRIIKFLDLFDKKAIHKIPVVNIDAVVSSLLDNGDLFPEGISGPLNLDTPMHIFRIVTDALLRIQDNKRRFHIILNAIKNSTKSVYILVYILRELTREHLKDEDTFVPQEFRLFTPEQLNELKQACVERIEYWSIHCDLQDHPRLLTLLIAWRDWDKTGTCKNYINKISQTDKGIIAFLAAILDRAIIEAMTSYEKNISWEKYLIEISKFIDPKKLEQHAKELFEDEYFEKLREREQLALMIFLDLMKAKTIKIIPKTTPN